MKQHRACQPQLDSNIEVIRIPSYVEPETIELGGKHPL